MITILRFVGEKIKKEADPYFGLSILEKAKFQLCWFRNSTEDTSDRIAVEMPMFYNIEAMQKSPTSDAQPGEFIASFSSWHCDDVIIGKEIFQKN